MSSERALPISVQAARELAGVDEGLVVVLLRDQQVAGALHLPGGATEIARLAAEAVRADQAVLIIIGGMRQAGQLLIDADQTQKVLVAHGIPVTASIHLSSFEDGEPWTDLSLEHPHDGIFHRIARRWR